MGPFCKERTRDTEAPNRLGYPEKLSCDEYCGLNRVLGTKGSGGYHYDSSYNWEGLATWTASGDFNPRRPVI